MSYDVYLADENAYKSWIEKWKGKDLYTLENQHAWDERFDFMLQADELSESFQFAGLELSDIKDAMEGETELSPSFFQRLFGKTGNKEVFDILRFAEILYWSFLDTDQTNDFGLETDDIGIGLEVSLNPESIKKCRSFLDVFMVANLRSYLDKKDVQCDIIKGTFILDWVQLLDKAISENKCIVVEVPC